MKSTATSSTQSTTSSLNFGNQPVPGRSQQTEALEQEAIHAWLTKTHSRLHFLSQIEHSNSFANLISSLDLDKAFQPKSSAKDSIKLLLALDDFVTKEKNSSLSIQFIEKLLKNCRSLIKEYRYTHAKLIPLEKTINHSSLTEDLKQLQIKLVDLKKEEKQLQKTVDHDVDVELTPLIELTHDLEKFKFENDRDFIREIAVHEAKLKSFTQKLDEINEQAITCEEELTFPIDQLEANLRINQRKLYYLKVDLYTLKQIRIDDIIKKLSSHLELKNTRLTLLSELKECDPLKILKTQIEHLNTKQEDLRTESKIKKDLIQNEKNLNPITEFFKDIIQLVPIKNNNIIKSFLEKIQSILNLNIDKNTAEAKQAKSSEESTSPQEELIAFLQQNESEFIENLKELANEKQAKIEKLQLEKHNLEIVSKKNILNNQITEVLEKIQTIKNDQHIFSIIEDYNLVNPLNYLKKLQETADDTEQKIKKFENLILEIKNQITDLEREGDKKHVTLLNPELNKEKIKSCAKIKILEKKKNKYILDLNEQLKDRNVELQLEKDYRDQIQKEIKVIRDIKTKKFESILPKNKRSLRFNAIDIRRLNAKIEKQKLNINHEIQRKLLIEQIVNLSEENNIQPEQIFYDSMKAQLIDLEKQVKNIAWNKSGWGFFFKKVPDGIQKIRAIFNAKTFDTSESESNVESNNLTMNIFSEIYSLIKQKNSSTQYLRSPAVMNFYQSLQESLTQVINQFLALNEPVIEMHDNTQPTCSTFPN